MRRIERIFVHCTASWQETTTLKTLWNEFKAQGWKHAGYHIVVFPNGKVEQMEDEETIANGVRGYNSTAIHVAWVGGIKYDVNKKLIPVDNRTIEQKIALYDILTKLKLKYRNAIIMGHRDISPDLNHNGVVDPWERIKECPCFDCMMEYMDINKIG